MSQRTHIVSLQLGRAIAARSLSYLILESLIVSYQLTLFEEGASASRIASALLFVAGPIILLSPLIGWALDRYAKRLVGLVAIIAGMVFLPGMLVERAWVPLVSLAAISTSCASVSSSCQASVPELVPRGDIATAMGYSQAGATVMQALAPAIAGVVHQILGGAAVIVFLEVIFAFALVLTYFGNSVGGLDSGRDSPSRQVSVSGGLRSVLSRPRHVLLLLQLMLFTVLAGATNVVEVLLLRGHLGATAFEFGAIVSAWPVGVILGAQSVRWLKTEQRQFGASSWLAVTASLALATIGMSSSLPLTALLFFLGGAANGALNTLVAILVISQSPSTERGRVASVVNAAASFALVASLAAGAGMAILFDPARQYVVAGSIGAAASMLLSFSSRRASSHRLEEAKV